MWSSGRQGFGAEISFQKDNVLVTRSTVHPPPRLLWVGDLERERERQREREREREREINDTFIPVTV